MFVTFLCYADSSIKYFRVMSSNNHEWLEKNFKCQGYIGTSIHVHVYINIDEKTGHDEIIDLIRFCMLGRTSSTTLIVLL